MDADTALQSTPPVRAVGSAPPVRGPPGERPRLRRGDMVTVANPAAFPDHEDLIFGFGSELLWGLGSIVSIPTR